VIGKLIKSLKAKSLKSYDLQAFIIMSRGGGIRTPGTRKGSPVFKTGAINRSTTPLCAIFTFLRTAKVSGNSVSAKSTAEITH
jgi:hypothetical protein